LSNGQVVDLLRDALVTAFWLSLPALVMGFIAGIVLSLAQIITSIQDTTFSTVPRLAVFLGALLLAMPWMWMRLITYTSALLENLGKYAH
jgi:flagellar biosynthetic protein FliQ